MKEFDAIGKDGAGGQRQRKSEDARFSALTELRRQAKTERNKKQNVQKNVEKPGCFLASAQKEGRTAACHGGMEIKAKRVERKKQDTGRREQQNSVRPTTSKHFRRYAYVFILHRASVRIPQKIH